MTLITWDNSNFTWDNNPHTWDDVALIKEAIGGGGVMTEDMPWMKWDDKDDRKKGLIKLICKVQGKTITEEKEIQEYKITVDDVRILAKEVLGIEIMTENIKF